MKQEFLNLEIKTNGLCLYEFTSEIISWIKSNKFKNGLLNISIQHTSASLIVQENADPDVQTDLINYFEGVARFDFGDLCNKNIGAEDYIKIADVCKHIIIENLPNFNENNSNQQQRFITLIDIIYEKKVNLTISSDLNLNKLTSAKSLSEPFKRTISRLYELTSILNT